MSTPPRARRLPRGRRLVVDVLGVALLLGGGGLVAQRQLHPSFQAAGRLPVDTSVSLPAAAPPAPPAQTPPAQIPPAQIPPAQTRPAQSPAGGPPAGVLVDASFPPQRLAVPALDVDARVVPVGVESGGGLTIPVDARTVGWWSGGAAPGSPVGTVLLAGHVDAAGQGPGALYRLATTPIGATVTPQGPGGARSYVVQARRRYLKSELPWRSLFAQGRQPRLILITCGGDFDYRTKHYTDNVVVVATPSPITS
ncbi:MAG: class F sortase [Pseudorhodobacter sp.]|nr:class F sortase [Frankiaceae bacterium]